MQALEIWRTAFNKRDAVALVTELNSESTYLERLCRSGTDSSTDESVVGGVSDTPRNWARVCSPDSRSGLEGRPLKAVGNPDTYVVIVLTAPTGVYIQVRNSRIEIASLETKSPSMPIPNI
jgi:hypothetical protein